MLSKLFNKIIQLSPTIRRAIWKWWYQKLAKKTRGEKLALYELRICAIERFYAD